MAERAKCTPFGKKIKIAMVESGISSGELARRIGYTNATISDVIYGRNCSPVTQEAIARELGIPFERDADK